MPMEIERNPGDQRAGYPDASEVLGALDQRKAEDTKMQADIGNPVVKALQTLTEFVTAQQGPQADAMRQSLGQFVQAATQSLQGGGGEMPAAGGMEAPPEAPEGMPPEMEEGAQPEAEVARESGAEEMAADMMQGELPPSVQPTGAGQVGDPKMQAIKRKSRAVPDITRVLA